MKEKVALFKALADENRLKILRVIAKQEVCACDLINIFDLKQPTISHHLKVLADAKLITVAKRGKWCFYNINFNTVSSLHEVLDDLINNKDEVEFNLNPSSCDGFRSK